MSHYPEASFITSAHQARQFVPDTGAEVAFAGRSNAGNSSAINALVNQKNFARTSKSPGRTQLINFFSLGEGVRLVDLPGYGFARVSRSMQQHWRTLMGNYFERRKSLAGIFVIVDIRRGLTDFDWQMIDWAERIGCPAHVLLTKADKLKRGAAANAYQQVKKELPEGVTVQRFSALTRDGVDEGRQMLDRLLAG